MWRYGVGVVAGLLLALGGVLWFRPEAVARHDPLVQAGPPAASVADTPLPAVPTATDRTREEKRFARYDKDRDGKVSREEWLASRRKAFAKLDSNGDGRLSFDEWATKTETRFAAADGDRNGDLTPAEFARTRIERKARAAVRCPPGEIKGDDDAG